MRVASTRERLEKVMDWNPDRTGRIKNTTPSTMKVNKLNTQKNGLPIIDLMQTVDRSHMTLGT